LIAACDGKRTYDWDHTADKMALEATAHWGKPFQRADFHPLRDRIVHEFQLDDPGAEYERLKALENKC
jgi:hypothetical protein